MNKTVVRILIAAASLMLLSCVIFAIIKLWIYAALTLCGALGCGAAALNFSNGKDS